MNRTSIEWAEMTWNPTTGCRKISPGCEHCYAAAVAKRRWGERPFEDVREHADRLDQPLKLTKPKRIFVDSMSDLFHDAVSLEFIAEVYDVMACATRDCGRRHEHEEECWQGDPHTYLVLTKRPQRAAKVIDVEIPRVTYEWPGNRPICVMMETGGWPLPNVQMGVSVESQEYMWRVRELLKIPAAVRFVSAEPLLGRLDFGDTLEWLDGVIVGGESGVGARPCWMDDVKWVVDQCVEAGVPAYVKQLGARPTEKVARVNMFGKPVIEHKELRLLDAKGGKLEEWPEWARVRELPRARATGT